MPPRRSLRLQPTEQGAGVAPRRSLRLRPEIHAREDGAGVIRRIRRRRTGISLAASPAPLPEDDGLLREVPIHLPSQPYTPLCPQPQIRTMAESAGMAPSRLRPQIEPTEEAAGVACPRSPRQRLQIDASEEGYNVLDCRHGLLLLKNGSGTEIVVCDPITRDQLRVAIPPELGTDVLGGAVLCAASDLGHVHGGGCDSSPFKVVLVSTGKRDCGHLTSVYCVYSSETGVWRDLSLTGAPCWILEKSAVLLGDCLYWLSLTDISIVEFDLDEHSITTIKCPPVTFDITYGNSQIIQAEDGAVASLHCLIPASKCGGGALMDMVMFGWLLGYDEVTDVVFLSVDHRVYMVQLKSMQSRKLHETRYTADRYYPFTSFYVPGIAIAGGL
ncbi:unnamed protein product [Alopecurus aequalis]